MKGTLKGCKMTNYQEPMHIRLEPRTPFKGGRITDTDVLTLTEAARFASVHAGTEITPADFLRAAGRGEITMRAIVHQTAKLQKIGGGVYCNAGQSTENTVPKGSILNLPLTACSHLAAVSRASWRTFDGFELQHGILMRYSIAELMPDEPDFETTTDDCRVTGNAVNALADAYVDEPTPAQTATPAPVVASDGPAKRRTWRDVAWHYMVLVFNAGQFTTAKTLYQALENKAGKDSPFDVGTGANRGSLVVREISETLSLKTVQNAWAELKEYSRKA
jgi:hypothetical protein